MGQGVQLTPRGSSAATWQDMLLQQDLDVNQRLKTFPEFIMEDPTVSRTLLHASTGLKLKSTYRPIDSDKL